ncbi:MAG TPA: hypothetical protein VJS15_06075 [Allosphingosinicella sp.]|nr:hypothetical protein [Allosphingosinicella sp.]
MTGPEQLRAQAARCRALARRATDGQVAANLLALAVEYDGEAERAEVQAVPKPTQTPE